MILIINYRVDFIKRRRLYKDLGRQRTRKRQEGVTSEFQVVHNCPCRFCGFCERKEHLPYCRTACLKLRPLDQKLCIDLFGEVITCLTGLIPIVSVTSPPKQDAKWKRELLDTTHLDPYSTKCLRTHHCNNSDVSSLCIAIAHCYQYQCLCMLILIFVNLFCCLTQWVTNIEGGGGGIAFIRHKLSVSFFHVSGRYLSSMCLVTHLFSMFFPCIWWKKCDIKYIFLPT